MVVIRPFSTPNASFNTFTTGARQLVVHDALDTHWSSDLSASSFTPRTIILSIASLEGTVRITFFAPFFRWSPYPPLGLSLERNTPVDSTTTSGVSDHGILAGFFSADTLYFTPSTMMFSSSCDTPGN